MNYKLSNDELDVTFTTLGGTLCSIKDKEGVEYLWQGDKTYWSGQAPVLFPICGSIRDDRATVGGDTEVKMPRHGIVRKKEFKMEKIERDSITFSIESTPELKEQFPFEFKLLTHYKLQDRTIRVTYEVCNTGHTVFPFFVGGHPGFNCPLAEGEKYEDYQLVFEKEETCSVPYPVTETGLIDMSRRTPFFRKERKLALRHELFERDAVILDELKSRRVRLESVNTGQGVTLSFADFPYLILWSSSNGGPFVALEPWTGLSTCNDEGEAVEDKRNVQFVDSNESKSHTFEITVNERK